MSVNTPHLSAISEEDLKWPRWDGAVLVPYSIEEGYDHHDRAVLALAVTEFHKKTCVRFVEKTNRDEDYLHITYEGSKGGCSSAVGKQGGRQLVTMDSDSCLRKGRQVTV